MTIRNWLDKYMTDRGLLPKEAEPVLSFIETKVIAAWLIKQSSTHAGEQLRWVSFNAFVIEWLDANEPMHFARPMFLPEAERKAILGV